VTLAEDVMRRVVEPAAVRYYQWRGDPLARWMGPAKDDPYPLYESVRRRGLFRSRLGPWVTASHATAAAILRDRRFSSSPVHQRGYQPPAEELLRYDSPVQMTSRIATEDADVGGIVIRQGTPVIVAIGGANRDPDAFSEPDRLRVSRPDAARHLSFSLGVHHCLGAPLARLEGKVALEELTRTHPGLALAGTPARRPQLVLRGFESVPVRADLRRAS
jgi:cytochrome P450